MRLLLDTHIFLWYVSADERLSPSIQAAVADPANDVFLSVASTWEAVIKYNLGKLPIPVDPSTFFPMQRELHRIASLPIEEASLKVLSKLPPIHRDPFDRIIIAQSIEQGLSLVTDDDWMKRYQVTIFR